MIEATREEAVGALVTREAWIYRDWQAAIGDWMLIHDSEGVRRFDVRSYRSFVGAELEPNGDDKEWIARLREVTDDLDVQGDPLHELESSSSAGLLRGRHLNPPVPRCGARAIGSRSDDRREREGDL